MEKERIQKIIAQSGLCSRRKAEEYIQAGRVQVNGHPALIGQKLDPARDRITVDGQLLPTASGERFVYLMMNKPRGYLTAMSDDRGRRCVTELLPEGVGRVYPIGRLDLIYIAPKHVTGFYTIDALLEGSWDKFFNAWAHLFAPILSMVICNTGPILKMAQATMLRTQREEFVRFAKDNGLAKKRVESMIFRNSLPPVLTLMGYIYMFMLGGSVLVENIFSWGGMGQYAVQSITHSDYAPMQMIVLITALISFIVYLVLDIIYYSIDPRVEI